MAFLVLACDPGDVVLLAPDGSGSEAPSTSIRVVVDTPYVALAESLGWTSGVPGARVRFHNMDEPYDDSYWVTATTDTSGVAIVVDLLAGLYEVEVSRVLDSVEIARVQGSARLLAGGRRLFATSSGVREVAVVPDRRGSLVFSEFGLAWPLPWDIPQSASAGARYFEIFNNSDTTVYLDGKYWGVAWNLNSDSENWPCAQTVVVRNDPEGIWAREIMRFPGSGNDYPLAPGGTILIARAAIDHRAVHPDLPDLSHADFALGASAAADNPDVPNLQDIGPTPLYPTTPMTNSPVFLSDQVDLETLPRYIMPLNGSTWLRIPRASVIDVWVGQVDWSTGSGYTPSPPCNEDVHRYFERLSGPAGYLSDFYEFLSFQRKTLTVLPDGRVILQDTNTSMFDFVKAVRTPGWIP